MQDIAAVVFDLDGTLVDTERLYRTVFEEAAAAHGVSVRPAFHDSLVGLSSQDRIPRLAAEYGADFPVPAFLGEYRRRKQAALAAGASAMPGAHRLLDALMQTGIPCAVATSATRPTAERVLKQAGLFACFATVVTRQDVLNGKPAPETHLAAAHGLGVPPGRCLALEDSAPGLAAAAAAGMRVVRIGPGGRSLAAVLALWRAGQAVPA